jgi:long-chain fatty acid transport protein
MANTYHVARRIQIFGFAILLSMTASSALASGFALIEQSVSSMGSAYAGAGSAATDASYIFFNPASMSRLDGKQLSGGLHVVLPNSDFSGDAVYTPSHPAFNPPSPLAPYNDVSVGGGTGGDGGVTGVVPHFAYVQDLNKDMKIGVTVNVPFGLSTEYDADWLGRYSAIESEIVTININPTISYKVDEHTTVGVGVSAMYANLKLDNAVDFALLELLGAHPIPGGPFYGGCVLPTDPGCPGMADGISSLDVDDWGFGFNFGILLEPTDSTRFGIAYRSSVKVDLGGSATLSEAAFGSVPLASNVEASLPDTLLLSAYHEVNPKTALMADVMWTQWSKINALVANLPNGTSNVIPLKYEDSLRYAVGGSYQYSPSTILRTGIAYDETPVSDAQHRPAALPGNDRLWVTLGLGYKFSNEISLDFGYAHLFIDDSRINSTDSYNTASGIPLGFHQLDGSYEADTDIISAQVNWKF